LLLDSEWTEKDLVLASSEILLMSSLLCSTDVIAAISMVKYEEQPTLFSLLFGEGIVNDAVAIILFNTVLKFSGSEGADDFTWKAPFAILGDFFALGFCSTSIGLVYGLITAFLFKKIRALTWDATVECLMIFCFAYMAYATAEIAGFSGIIALLTAGVVMAHYAWYNLSHEGQHGSYLVFQTMGLAMQGFIFSYLGVSFFSFASLDWSWHLILLELGICIIGRFGGTLGLIGFLRLCGYKSGISWKQVFFMGYAGLIRGAIAFGLVLRIDTSAAVNREVIVTTCLTLVVFTTVFFGATVGPMQSFLFPKEARHLDDNVTETSVQAEALHPNEEREEEEEGGKRKRAGCCLKTWTRLDEFFFKPCLIYEYRRKNALNYADFKDMFEDKEDKSDNSTVLTEAQILKLAQEKRTEQLLKGGTRTDNAPETYENGEAAAGRRSALLSAADIAHSLNLNNDAASNGDFVAAP